MTNKIANETIVERRKCKYMKYSIKTTKTLKTDNNLNFFIGQDIAFMIYNEKSNCHNHYIGEILSLIHIFSYDIYIEQCVETSNNAFDLQIEQVKLELEHAKTVYDRLMQTYDYYEIQPHVKSVAQIQYNKMLYEMSKKYNKPLIAGTDTHSVNSYKAECRSILQKAKHIEFSNEDEFDLTYKSYDELVEMFRQQNALPMDVILEAIENTNRMADSVTDYELDTTFKYPILYDNEEDVFIAVSYTHL